MLSPEEYRTCRAARRSIEQWRDWLGRAFSFANYLTELGDKAQADIYSKSSIVLALRDAFRKMRKFLMTTKKLTEDEATL